MHAVLPSLWYFCFDSLRCDLMYVAGVKSIDLFRLHILFSQYRSRGVHARIFMLACALFNQQNKEPILLSIITWFVLGNQNVQAKNVYWVYLSLLYVILGKAWHITVTCMCDTSSRHACVTHHRDMHVWHIIVTLIISSWVLNKRMAPYRVWEIAFWWCDKTNLKKRE